MANVTIYLPKATIREALEMIWDEVNDPLRAGFEALGMSRSTFYRHVKKKYIDDCTQAQLAAIAAATGVPASHIDAQTFFVRIAEGRIAAAKVVYVTGEAAQAEAA